MRAYAALAKTMALLPATTSEIANSMGADRCAVSHRLNTLRQLGLVYRWGVRQTGPRGNWAVVWAVGQGEEVRHFKSSQRVARFVKMGVTFALAYKAVADNPTTDEMAKAAAVSRSSAHDIIRHLRAEGLIHIGGWEKVRHTTAPTWAYGPGPDVKRPKPLSRKITNARYREARKGLDLQSAINDALFRKVA